MSPAVTSDSGVEPISSQPRKRLAGVVLLDDPSPADTSDSEGTRLGKRRKGSQKQSPDHPKLSTRPDSPRLDDIADWILREAKETAIIATPFECCMQCSALASVGNAALG